MTTIISFLVVLGILVIVHEFGHFIVARWCGVQVETFSVGFGPKIASKKVGPTEYCLSMIPLGGYVRMLGDDPNEEVDSELVDRAFLTQHVSKKIAIVFAGPFFNLMLAFFIFVGVFLVGVPALIPDVGEVQEGSAAEAGGMLAGDKVLSIEGEEVTQWEDIRTTLQKSEGRGLNFQVMREGRETDLLITPTVKTVDDVFGEPKQLWLIGILPTGDQMTKNYGLIDAIVMGMEKTISSTVLNVVGIVKLIQGKISADNIGGPIMIAKMAGDQASQGLLSVVLFTAILSINLGIINLFPIPVLDGGHLFFFAIEAIIGRPVSLKKREIAQQVGLFLIVSLMVFAIYNDIMRFFVNSSS